MPGNRPGGQPRLSIRKTLEYPADLANPGHHKVEQASGV
jgi:hypothetical protein